MKGRFVLLAVMATAIVVSCSTGGGKGDVSSADLTDSTGTEVGVDAAEVVIPPDLMPELPDTAVPEVVDVVDVQDEPEVIPDIVDEELAPPCVSDDTCEDGDFCTIDKCVSGTCLHQSKNCNDGNLCTDDSCDAATGQCGHLPAECDDGNPCTIDSCMPTVGCENNPIQDCCPGTVTIDEDFEGELAWPVKVEFSPEEPGATWQVSTARVHEGLQSLYFGNLEMKSYDLGDRVRAYVDSPELTLPADRATQVTFWLWLDAEATVNYDTFSVYLVMDKESFPVYGKKAGFIMKKWTLVTLDLQVFKGKKGKLRFLFDSIDGSDNDYEGVYIDSFQVTEMCQDEPCKTKVDCADNLACTEGKCIEGTCEYTVADNCCMSLVDCLDTDPCTIEACKENACTPTVLAPPFCCYEPADCDDNNVCTNDICDPSGICLHPPSQAPGCCKQDADCDDGNACTDNKCNPDDASCYFPNNTKPCDDKNKCTQNDVCKDGGCGGGPVVCNDGNFCTQDLCDPGTGCYYPGIPPGQGCDDLNPCTAGDVCIAGKCSGEWVDGCCLADKDCDDFDKCTIDKCTANACQNVNTCCFSDAECDDFDDVCTTDKCVDGACIYTPTGVEGCCAPILFRDDFSSDKGWEFGMEWQRGAAKTSGGQSYGNPDPANDHSATDDNFVAGVAIGGNAAQQLHDFYWATSPIVNAQFAQNLQLGYWRWLNSDYLPFMQNKVEVFDGQKWVTVWQTEGTGIQDASWTFQKHDITAYANPQLRVRFGFMIGSGGVFSVSSWNVDDVTVTVMPKADGPGLCCGNVSDCQGFYPEPIKCSGGSCVK
jgi:hypothetical protein